MSTVKYPRTFTRDIVSHMSIQKAGNAVLATLVRLFPGATPITNKGWQRFLSDQVAFSDIRYAQHAVWCRPDRKRNGIARNGVERIARAGRHAGLSEAHVRGYWPPGSCVFDSNALKGHGEH